MHPFPTQLSIGPLAIAPATVLAPMAGVTDTVFRRFIRSLGGCGLIMTEFTSSHGVRASMGARKPTKTLRYLAFQPDEHPISAQLFGADPEVMADAARVCQDLGFDILDINFGCPVNKVVKCNGGSGLLRDRILRRSDAAGPLSDDAAVLCHAGRTQRERRRRQNETVRDLLHAWRAARLAAARVHLPGARGRSHSRPGRPVLLRRAGPGAVKKIQLITDGACHGNPGPGGWAAILRYNQHKKEMWGCEPHTTNNRMELR